MRRRQSRNAPTPHPSGTRRCDRVVTRRPSKGEMDELQAPIGRAVRRSDRSHGLRIRTLVADPTDGERQTQRRAHRAGRHRLFALRLLRLDHRHAEHRSAGRQRSSLRQLSHDRALFADPRVPVDRAQPPRGRNARRVQHGYGVSEHAWFPAPLRRNRGGRAAGRGLWNLRRRQVAPDTDGGMLGSGAVPQLAVAAGIRSFLRFHAGRDGPVLSGANDRQPPHRGTGPAGRRLPRLGRRGRPLHQHVARPDFAGARAPVLSVPRLRCHPLTPPGAQGLPRQVSRQVRCGLGCDASRLVCASKGARHHPGEHRPRTVEPGRQAVGPTQRE